MSPFPSRSEYTAASALLLLDSSNNVEDPERWRRLPSAISQKAEAILNLLSSAVVDGCGCLREVKIRQKIGDSPDTSKALRQLLELKMVKRLGKGGRRHPYVYTIA